MTIYKHTQPATLVRVTFIVVALLMLVVFLSTGLSTILLVTLAVLFVCVVLFHSLTVEVTGEAVMVCFGPGLIKKSFSVADILKSHTVRNRWYYGWGIRFTPHGWLYNVSGLDAVEIGLCDGRTYRIGTDEPERLSRAIESARRES